MTPTTRHETPLFPPKDRSDTNRPYSWAVVLAPTSMDDIERSEESTHHREILSSFHSSECQVGCDCVGLDTSGCFCLILQFVHAGNHVFSHQINMVQDVLLGSFRVEQAYRHLAEPQIPVPADLLHALIGTTDDEGVVHQGF